MLRSFKGWLKISYTSCHCPSIFNIRIVDRRSKQYLTLCIICLYIHFVWSVLVILLYVMLKMNKIIIIIIIIINWNSLYNTVSQDSCFFQLLYFFLIWYPLSPSNEYMFETRILKKITWFGRNGFQPMV